MKENKTKNTLIYLLAGLYGGIVRGLVGFVKNKTIEKTDFIESLYKIRLGKRLSNPKL